MRKQKTESLQLLDVDCITFLTIGLSSQAICLIKRAGILDKILSEGGLRLEALNAFKNPPLIKAALTTLVASNVLSYSNNRYELTTLGKKLADNIDLFILPLVGYRKLFEKQYDLLDKPEMWTHSDIDYKTIAESSIGFGLKSLGPILLDVFRELNPHGTICDLGCGTGEKLKTICAALSLKGLGIEQDFEVVHSSEKSTKISECVQIIQGDITKLDEVYEEVTVAMLSFVLHDISSEVQVVDFLNSILVHFPNLQSLVIVDIVAMSESISTIMPGFDYVHGLQGIIPRTYNETIEVFLKANFTVTREVSVTDMPNTYVWVIQRNKSC